MLLISYQKDKMDPRTARKILNIILPLLYLSLAGMLSLAGYRYLKTHDIQIFHKDDSGRTSFMPVARNKQLEFAGKHIAILGVTNPKSKRFRAVILRNISTGEVRAFKQGKKAFGGPLVSSISKSSVTFNYKFESKYIQLHSPNRTKLDLKKFSDMIPGGV